MYFWYGKPGDESHDLYDSAAIRHGRIRIDRIRDRSFSYVSLRREYFQAGEREISSFSERSPSALP